MIHHNLQCRYYLSISDRFFTIKLSILSASDIFVPFTSTCTFESPAALLHDVDGTCDIFEALSQRGCSKVVVSSAATTLDEMVCCCDLLVTFRKEWIVLELLPPPIFFICETLTHIASNVNETLWCETETFVFQSETRPRPAHIFTRPRRSFSRPRRDRELTRVRSRPFSRLSCNIFA